MCGVAAIRRPSWAIVHRAGGNDTIADPVVPDVGTDCSHHAGDLVTENKRWLLGRNGVEGSVHATDVAVAQSRRAHLQDDFARSRPRVLALDKFKGLASASKQPRFHTDFPFHSW